MRRLTKIQLTKIVIKQNYKSSTKIKTNIKQPIADITRSQEVDIEGLQRPG